MVTPTIPHKPFGKPLLEEIFYRQHRNKIVGSIFEVPLIRFLITEFIDMHSLSLSSNLRLEAISSKN